MPVSDAEEKRNKIQKRIRDFRLFDDEFMTKIFHDDKECIELFLHIIMDKPDLKVKKTQVQHVIKNLQGRSMMNLLWDC